MNLASGVETIVQGTFVQGDFCPRRLLSKEDYCPRKTIVQGDICPRRQLSKETIVQGDFCPSTNEHARTVYWRMQARGKGKYIMRFEIR